MTIDQLASYQCATGAKVVKRCDTWWIEARPFFFRPLFPFAELRHDVAQYPLQSLIGGILHLVPRDGSSNTSMKLFLYDDLQDYSLAKMGSKERWIIKKGSQNFEARQITGLEAFVNGAYPIYQSFFARTNYFYKKERLKKPEFARWAETLFNFPQMLILGAYHQDKLAAVDISYQVEDVITDDVFFSDSESQGLRVTDFLLHSLREAAASSDAKYLFRGFPSGKETLDVSKTNRGCKILQLPAYCKINPLALYLGRVFMNESYKKLMAITSMSTETGGNSR